MKDIVSKLIFGFLMAQFVPGVITVCSLSFAYIALTGYPENTITAVYLSGVAAWSSTVTSKLAFLGLSTAAGMLIHGLHWAIVGCLESRFGPTSQTFWHRLPVIVQLLIGPIKIMVEIIILLFTSGGIDKLAVEENVTKIPKERMEAFHYLQDFYLHFAQFYAHTSYALLLASFSMLACIISLGTTPRRIMLLVVFYIFCGFTFLLGRVQLRSLFVGENELEKS